jgi:hypothetical protein
MYMQQVMRNHLYHYFISTNIFALIFYIKNKNWICFKQYFLNRVRVMVFSTTFNNISVISWWSVLLVEETGVPEENHWPAASHWQTLSQIVELSEQGQ